MFWRTSIVYLAAVLGFASDAPATILTGAPPGGSVTLHDGSFDIDLNGDGTVDLTIRDQPTLDDGQVAGSRIDVPQALNVGVYRGAAAEDAWRLNPGQEVGPYDGNNFVYSEIGLSSIANIPPANEHFPNGVVVPGWADGQRYFVGADVLSGSDHHYGWVELSLRNSGIPTSDEPWYDVTIYDWAYETVPNQPVTIPEPSSAAVILLALGPVLMRRRA